VKRSRLEFGCARITSAICGSVNLILIVGFISDRVGCHFTPVGRSGSPSGICYFAPKICSSLPVASGQQWARQGDLLLFAGYLFVAARTAWARSGEHNRLGLSAALQRIDATVKLPRLPARLNPRVARGRESS